MWRSADTWDLVNNIYDLPVSPSRWVNVFDRFLEKVDAGGGSIAIFDPTYEQFNNLILPSRYTEHPDLMAGYNQRCKGFDEKAHFAVARYRDWTFRSDCEVLGIHEADRDLAIPAAAYMREVVGIGSRYAACLNLHGAWSDVISLHFAIGKTGLSDEERTNLSPFLMHWSRVMELHRTFQALTAKYRQALGALDWLQIGICLVSPPGEIVFHNTEAARIFDAADGIELKKDRTLLVRDPEENLLLRHGIERAMDPLFKKGHGTSELTAISRLTCEDPYLVEALPLIDTSGEFDRGYRGVLLMIIDPNETESISTEGMQLLYKLTDAESEVCARVVDGVQTDQIAEERGVKLETVRSQIKALLEKTRSRNRVQLVRLAQRVNLPIR